MKIKGKYIILFSTLFLMTIGLIWGDLEEGILQKAISICFECIGIG